MKKNFKYLFEDRKVFGFYSDEIFIAVIVGVFVSAPIYLATSYMGIRVLEKLGGLLFLVVFLIASSAVLSTMKLVRGNDDKTFYVKVLGRNEGPKTFKGRLARLALYLMAFDKLIGKFRITKTRNYSP